MGGEWDLSLANQASRDSDRAVILPIWIERKYPPVRLPLIRWVGELLLGVEIAGGLDITVGFGKREFHTAQGEWQVLTHSKKSNWVCPLSPTSRGCANLGE